MPLYLDMSIPDLSKSLMYDFYYTYNTTKYEGNAKLLFTDTDSLAYEFKAKDFYKDFNTDIDERFDTQLLIHLELKQDLIAKCLECLRMKLVGSRLLNL